MRHLQLYESFNTSNAVVNVYTNIDLWMEFLKMNLSRDRYIASYEFWKGRFDRGVHIYTAEGRPNKSEGTWFFWEDPQFEELEIRMIRYNEIKNRVQSDSLYWMEEELGCSYQDLIKQAKSPEESMIQDVLQNPDTFDYYSEEAPLTLKKGIASAPEQIKALLKWKQIKNFI